MHSTIMTKSEDVIQSVDVLEYLTQILSDIKWNRILKHTLKLVLEILKGDFIIKGERPFKSFYWVVFYLWNGFKKLEDILHQRWLPVEIQNFWRNKSQTNINLNSTLNHDRSHPNLGSINSTRDVNNTEENKEKTLTKNVNKIKEKPKNLSKKKAASGIDIVGIDWEFFDDLNVILEYTNVVLNDLEIFQTSEIYSSFLRCYNSHLPIKVVELMLNTIYKITIDKNHRISNRRYNAMYSKDMIKTFNNIFCLFCLNVTSNDRIMQQKYFSLILKLVYHNILLVNDKTLCSLNMSEEFDPTKASTSFSQMNKGNGVSKDRQTNRNIKAIILQNPSIFDDLQLCFVKVNQESNQLGEDSYKERMIQIIFLYVYMLIACKDQSEVDTVEVIIQTKDYLFKSPKTIKYGMLFFMLIFSDKYNKSSFDFKKQLIDSSQGIDSLVLKLNNSSDEQELIRNLYLVCLVLLETNKELKMKVIIKINLLDLFDRINILTLSVKTQKTLISYILELCCLSNELLYFAVQDQVVMQSMFGVSEMKYIKETIDNVFVNLSEYLHKDDEDNIYYTENDFLSASQANFCAYVEEEEEQSVREAFAFIESDFLNCMFIILFQLDKSLKIEFLESLIPLIEQKNECRRVISKMETLEFFLKVYQYHRDTLGDQTTNSDYDRDYTFLNLLLMIVSFSLENGIPVDDDMYLYTLIKGGKISKIDEKLLLMLCRQVEYCDIPNNINFKETQDSFGLAAFVSKGKSLMKVEKEICISPYVSNIPSKKRGFWVAFWFRLKKLYDNMNLISLWDFKGEKVLKISVNIVREFENIDIQDRLGITNIPSNFENAFSNPKIKKYLEVKYTREDIYIKENVEIPFEFETNKVYHLYFW